MQIWMVSKWNGGFADGEKEGLLGSHSYLGGLNYRKYNDSVVLADRLVKKSAALMTNTPVAMCRDTNGEHYVQDAGGDVYEISTSTYTHLKVRDLTQTKGMGLAIFTASSTRYLFYGLETALGSVDVPDRSAFTDTGLPGKALALTSANYHPLLPYSNLLVVGNAGTIATLDDSANWTAAAITLPSGFEARCLAATPDYVVIGAYRGQSYFQSEGRLFFWDGAYDSWNFYEPIPEGGINSLWSIPGGVMFTAGGRGALYKWTKSYGLERIREIPRYPGTSFWFGSGAITQYPNSGCFWNGLSYFGTVTEDTADYSAAPFVYTYGTLTSGMQDTLNAELVISPADDASDLVTSTYNTCKIGVVYGGSPTELFVGWKLEGTPDTFGVDIIDTTDFVKEGFSISRVIDGDLPHLKKRWLSTKYTFDTLTSSNESMVFRYATDRSRQTDPASFTSLSTAIYSTNGAVNQYRAGNINVDPTREFQFVTELKADSTQAVSPRLYSQTVSAEIEPDDTY